MRIVLHAGLHKSGTTTVQSRWKAAYTPESVDGVRYPRRGGHGPPGHHYLVRPLLSAFTEQRDPDLVLAAAKQALRGGRVPSLTNVVRRAAEDGVDTLVVSAEDLDRVRPEDAIRLQEAWAGHEVDLLLTMTQPVHRWCSGWQELVKHGLADYPGEAAELVMRFAALTPGRAAQVVRLLAPARTVVRLVRSAPPEPNLAEELARLLGLPPPSGPSDPGPANESLGRDIEILVRLNRAGLALGTDRQGREHLERLRSTGFGYRPVPSVPARYAVPPAVAAAAASEVSWLTAPAADLRVIDPHCLLAGWADLTVPGWYDAIAREEADLPELDLAPASCRGEMSWRERQRQQARLARSEHAER